MHLNVQPEMAATLAVSRGKERHGAACAILVLSTIYSKSSREEAGVWKQNLSFSPKGTFSITT